MNELIAKLKNRRKGIVYLLKMVPLEIWDWKPHPSTKTTAELANHLASSPLMLLELIKGDLTTPEEFESLEKQNFPINAEGLTKLYDMGLEKIIAHLEANIDDAQEKNLKFFYQEQKTSLYHEIFEEIGHEWFHSGQLFAYLRTNGVNVDMGAYYGYQDPDPTIPPN